VHEVHDDGDWPAAGAGLGADGLDLVGVAVHERDPRARPGRVTPVGLVEHGRDDGGGLVGDRGVQPLTGRLGPGTPPAAFGAGRADHIGRVTRYRGGVVDRHHLGHAFTAPLLAFGQTGGKLGAGGRLGRGRAQRLGTHHDPFGVGGQDQHIAVRAAGHLTLRVERVDVGCCRGRQRLDLTFADREPGRGLHRGLSVLERALRRRLRDQPAQPV